MKILFYLSNNKNDLSMSTLYKLQDQFVKLEESQTRLTDNKIKVKYITKIF